MIAIRKHAVVGHVSAALTYAFLGLASLMSVFPILWIVSSAFKDKMHVLSYPPTFVFSPTLDAFRAVFSYPKGSGVYFWHFFQDSVVVSLLTAVGVILISFPAAYSIARLRFHGRSTSLFIILATRMVPPIAMLVPLYLFASNIGIHDKYLALVITYLAIGTPLATWILVGFIQNVDVEIEEAAFLDGCTKFQMFIRILLPLVAPGIVVVSFIAFLLAWNDYTMASVLTVQRTRTVTILAMMFIAPSEEGNLIAQMGAVATLVMTPPILYIFFAQRYLRSGIGLGSLKGN